MSVGEFVIPYHLGGEHADTQRWTKARFRERSVQLVAAPGRAAAQVFSVQASYHVFDPNGAALANVREINLSPVMKVLRFFSENSDNFPANLQLSGPHGEPLLIVHKPFAFFHPKTQVRRPDGTLVGYIAKDFKLVGSRFHLLDPSGNRVGEISGDWLGWEFSITDGQGTSIAQVSKRFAGLTKEFFTTADRYAVQIHYQLPEPLRSLVIASTVTIDLVLHQSKN
ncbi:MAG: scramblase [Streptosporangiales bacterium]|nr:scramblase [Streptosporangiales bacterium]